MSTAITPSMRTRLCTTIDTPTAALRERYGLSLAQVDGIFLTRRRIAERHTGTTPSDQDATDPAWGWIVRMGEAR